MQLEVEYPKEGGVLVKTPELLGSVVHGEPAFLVEALGLLWAAEEQREREFAILAVLWHVDEVDYRQLLVKTPGPEMRRVYVSRAYPDLHG